MASVFGITAANLQAKLVPANIASNNPDGYISIGETGDLTEAEALAIIEEAEAIVLGRLPLRYQMLIERCDGEILVRRAYEGQTSLQVSLYPIVTDTLKLYTNYPLTRGWLERNDDDIVDSDDYSVNLNTGVVTLDTGLVSGDRIWAEYQHTAAQTKLQDLRYVALTLAAVEAWRRLRFHKEAFDESFFQDWETTAYQTLNRFKGSYHFEKVDLLRETNFSYDPILRF